VRRAAAAALLALGVALAAPAARAGSLHFCDRPTRLDAIQQDRLLRIAGLVRETLEASGASGALLARSGQNLGRFGQRYSHAGASLRANANAPWSVRQLYYACDEGAPRLFDQGISGFVLGNDDPTLGYFSIVTLPPAAADSLQARALDDAYALALLGREYSANAYPFDARYQNCNQWLAELLAGAWGALDSGADLRERAQRWLQQQGYQPTLIDASSLLLTLVRPFVPWVHVDDHPPAARQARRYLVSMPSSIEAFVREQVPGAERLEICHDGGRVVIHRGWDEVADGCRPGAQDRVVELD